MDRARKLSRRSDVSWQGQPCKTEAYLPKALEFALIPRLRMAYLWSLNTVLTLSYAQGQRRGPINSDTDFGRYGPPPRPSTTLGEPRLVRLPAQRPSSSSSRVRGAYALGEHWQVGGTFTAQSGRPINATGEMQSLRRLVLLPASTSSMTTQANMSCARAAQSAERRGYSTSARMSTYRRVLGGRSQSHTRRVQPAQPTAHRQSPDGELVSTGDDREFHGLGSGYQAPRYGLLTVKLDF